MSDLRQAAQQALEALERYRIETPLGHQPHMIAEHADSAIAALRAALAEPEQPVAWMDMVVASLVREGVNKHRARELAQHFCAAPTPRRPLTDEEIRQIALDTPIDGTNFARAIERAHGIGDSNE